MSTPKQQFNIEPRFGELNPIQKPDIQRRINLYGGSHLDVLKKAAEIVYTPDALAETGPYKAIVLKTRMPNDEQEAGSWLARYYNSILGKDKTDSINLLQVKARIPELHSMLPIPKTLGDNSEDDYIIEMYPTFIAMNQDVSKMIPQPGEIVWVDYVNKKNLSDPIYMGPVVSSKGTSDGKGNPSATTSYTSACGNRFNSESPDGDVLTAKNKPLSHAGALPGVRTTKANASTENKLVRGDLCSNEIVEKWQEALKQNIAYGITWIGNLPSNGRVDDQHIRGKRNTIIYSPNKTDYDESVELIFFFHSFGGFNNNFEFKERILAQTIQLDNSDRNYILVVPELPWSNDTQTPNGRINDSFVGNDNFIRFYKEALDVIKDGFSPQVKINLISFISHGAGANVLGSLSKTGVLSKVKPTKIVFSDVDSYDIMNDIWKNYTRGQDNTELDILTPSSGVSYTNAKKLFTNNAIPENNKKIYYETFKKESRQIGNFSIVWTNPIIQKEKDEQTKALLQAYEQNPNNDVKEMSDDDLVIANSTNKNIRRNFNPPNGLNDKVSPSAIPKTSSTRKELPKDAVLEEAKPFVETRVYLKDYAPLNGDNELLVPILSVGYQQKVHILAAKRFNAMNEAWMSENPGQTPIKVASGWRPQKFATQQEYEAELVKRYSSRFGGDPEIAKREGRKLLAFNSAHTAGLAFDIGNNGLAPISQTATEQMYSSPLWKWLKNNAHRFGVTPYFQEPWHWECRLPRESWISGIEFTDNYAVRVASVGKGGTVPASFGASAAIASTNCVRSVGELRG